MQKNSLLSRPDVDTIFTIFQNNIKIVGGAVRDFLLKKKINDIDFATPLPPDEIIDILRKNNIPFLSHAKQYGTIVAILNKKPYEITTLRMETNHIGRHCTVSFTTSYEIDASRRDLTINALYMDYTGAIFDYHNGINDLKAKKIHFIGNPNHRIKEDYLRILRFCRFQAYYGNNIINSATLTACAQNTPYLPRLSDERIKTELFKIISHKNPLFILRIMDKMGVFQHLKIEVNIDRLALFLQNAPASTPLQRLAILIDNINNAIKLSNNEKRQVRVYTKSFDFKNSAYLPYYVWQLGKKDYIFHLYKYLIDNPLDNDTIEYIKKIKKPRFTLSGKDLLKLGYKNGEIGEKLNECIKIWIDMGYPIQKTLVLKKLLLYTKIKTTKG